MNIDKHCRIIAYIFLVLGFLSLAFGVITFNTYYLVEEWFRPELPNSIDLGILTIHNPFQWLVVLPILNIFVAVFKIITGFGILQNKKWAYKLALVIAFFWFFQFPIGTAFSFYILYSFLDDEALRAFKTEERNSDAEE